MLFLTDGTVQGLYTEAIDLTAIGTIRECKRVSNVDWKDGEWIAREIRQSDAAMSDEGRTPPGRVLGCGKSRKAVLAEEAEYFGEMGWGLFVKGK